MKKRMFKGSHFLLPICLSLAMGLTSCEKDEIIALEEDDFTGDLNELLDVPANTKDYTDFVYKEGENEEAVLIGYMDKLLEPVDLNGNPVTARNDNSSILRASLSVNDSYGGLTQSYYTSGTNKSTGWIQVYSYVASNASSLVVAPGCTVTLASHRVTVRNGAYHYPNTKEFAAYNSGEARYIRKFSSYTYPSGQSLDNRVRFIKITCNDTENKFCGYAFKDVNYGGDRLPIFKKTDLNLSHNVFIGWNNQVSSISTNRYSSCDGIMIYDDESNFDKPYHWVHPDDDLSSLTNLNPHSNTHTNRNEVVVKKADINDAASVIKHSTKVVHHFYKANFPIGAIVYTATNFKGNMYIIPKGGKIDNWSNRRFRSVIVPPDVSVSFDENYIFGGEQHRGSKTTGYWGNIDFNVNVVTPTAVNNNINDFCGVLHDQTTDTEVDSGIAVNTSSNYDFPVFQNITNKTADDGNKFWQFWGSDFNERYSTFISYPFTTNCKGVTVWEHGNPTSIVTAKREWYPAYASSKITTFSLDALNNQVSAFSAENCTSSETGINPDNYIAFADKIIFDPNNNGTFNRIGKQTFCDQMRKGCEHGRNFYFPYIVDGAGCAVGLLGSVRAYLAPYMTGRLVSITDSDNTLSASAYLLPTTTWTKQQWLRFAEAVTTGYVKLPYGSPSTLTTFKVPGNIYKQMLFATGTLIGSASAGGVAGYWLDRLYSWATGFTGGYKDCEELYNDCMDDGDLDQTGSKK
jgi:hypothetical protein